MSRDDDRHGLPGEPTKDELDTGFAAVMASLDHMPLGQADTLHRRGEKAELGHAAYAMGIEHLRCADTEQATRWLRTAARYNIPEAQHALDGIALGRDADQVLHPATMAIGAALVPSLRQSISALDAAEEPAEAQDTEHTDSAEALHMLMTPAIGHSNTLTRRYRATGTDAYGTAVAVRPPTVAAPLHGPNPKTRFRPRGKARDAAGNPIMRLVEQAQDGDSDSFGQLYDHYSDTVYRYIYYRVGSKATAEDLTSETFLRALRRIGTFTWQGRDFGAWLVTIARNLVADHFKTSRFRLEVTTGEMLDSNECERSPEDSVLESLSNAALMDVVRQLSPQQQECVRLRFLQGLSVPETARIMGKNEGAVKTLQFRAVRKLARLLTDEEE